ncbi:RNA methyltransferase, TrmH family, group 3 [Planctopirus limnophila DSM 3776]|uniref:RNA methyltransferase, TrmH family, group 3 n=1 Tax=Planctopirus limnophila (strain ATCC 43296 / DSM 3776 / IFAM 1008 / Mu 290) TaxID=521674 RepID=D5SXM8_PLAL2|nr:RNA methyltransferase, TrmH family, group 3 [Planctopirus limnophila DSM 3776]
MPKLLGNHNRSWIWGRHLVSATIHAKYWIPLELHYDSHRFSPHDPLGDPIVGDFPLGDSIEEAHSTSLKNLCEAVGIQLVASTADQLSRLIRAEDHQGLAARMPEFPYADFEGLFQAQLPALLVILDGIQDSFNLGAIIRCAEALGAGGIVLPEKGQSGVNSQAARSSAGAVNFLPIYRVPALDRAIDQLKSRGMKILAATEKSEQSLWNVVIPAPLCLIIGNEGKGVSSALLSACDIQVRIPMAGQTSSLNAAVAAGILLAEIQRQSLKI